ncbi:zinc ribbon domain-containing protein [Salinibacter ruber]|jgi:rubredoxin|uniref:zinc ribbon domain-containing protein n=1 Tax=Salinibacter ruber TaxID=146919 RepID=UPI0020749F02|nr:zinc ribbon domain-containing protein [Salinibacter ruber]MCS4182166.1 putative Zn-ribbon and HTH transcriptional regulator [Salinibacter ruber]
MITGILLVQAVAFAILSAIIASNKNRSAGGWGALGFLFGLFGFIAAIAVGEVEDDTRSSRRRSSQQKSSSSEKKQTPRNKEKESASQTFDPDEHEKKCPMCAEYIKLEARRCKHCGHEFSEEEVERQIEEKRKEIEGERQDEDDETEKTINMDNLTKPQRYSLDTHRFIDDGSECERCGLSKAYIVEHLYKCPYSDR